MLPVVGGFFILIANALAARDIYNADQVSGIDYMMDYPCPHCSETFTRLEELFQHTFITHYEGEELKPLTKSNFTKSNDHWECRIGGFNLKISRDTDHFILTVTGVVEPIPARFPTEPEWEEALKAANQFYIAYVIAQEKE